MNGAVIILGIFVYIIFGMSCGVLASTLSETHKYRWWIIILWPLFVLYIFGYGLYLWYKLMRAGE